MKNDIYIHDSPGRLRVRAVKNQARAAAEVQELLAAMPGVIWAQAHMVTGSMVLGCLREHGYLERNLAPAKPSKIPQGIVDRMVERALAAALATIF